MLIISKESFGQGHLFQEKLSLQPIYHYVNRLHSNAHCIFNVMHVDTDSFYFA